MNNIFLTVLNMSLVGAFVIMAICLARLPLKRAPKIISYCLWAVAGFRLIFPASIESALSLIPFRARIIEPDVIFRTTVMTPSNVYLHEVFANGAVQVPPASAMPIVPVIPYAPFVPQLYGSFSAASPAQFLLNIGAYIWLFGFAAMVIYGAVSYIILTRKMRGAVCVGENIYKAENIKSPFVLGLITPKIYLPDGLFGAEYDYILLHERTHIRRNDHAIKFAAYFILALHWFNPLAWIAFLLMSADMEMSCDEYVLKKMGPDAKTGYSLSLVSFAENRRLKEKNSYSPHRARALCRRWGEVVVTSPLAFSEGGMKERIKNVLNFKKHSRIVVAASVMLVIALSVGLMADRSEANQSAADMIIENYTDYYPKYYADSNEYEKAVISVLPQPDSISEPAGLISSAPQARAAEGLHRWEEDVTPGPAARTYQLLEDSFRFEPLPLGWHLNFVACGGYNLPSHRVRVPDIMLLPNTLVIHYAALDAPWGDAEEAVLLEQAAMLFDYFAELRAVHFAVRALERGREVNESIFTDAQFTVARDAGGGGWHHEDSITQIIPFFVPVTGSDFTFRWIPAGYDESEVKKLIHSLPLPDNYWKIAGVQISDAFVLYGSHVYSISINYNTPNINSNAFWPAQISEENFEEIAAILFAHFDDLKQVGFGITGSAWGGAYVPQRVSFDRPAGW